MTYEWNPLWSDVVQPINDVYVAKVRRMVLASINWFAEHPDANPQWSELNTDKIAERAGVPPGVNMLITGAWEDFYRPQNSHARRWFRTILAASGTGEPPSYHMMSKAVACGMLFKTEGWDAFNMFMLEKRNPDEATH